MYDCTRGGRQTQKYKLHISVSPESFVVHSLIRQVVILQIQLPQTGKFAEGSFGNLLQLVALDSPEAQSTVFGMNKYNIWVLFN